ncbi:hypothetical protein LMG28690_02675 [Paraburkholderia caffeinilytica]|nr:hypothetical protein LMG28690_02675 [Paraburkholderia caffeinilytica]
MDAGGFFVGDVMRGAHCVKREPGLALRAPRLTTRDERRFTVPPASCLTSRGEPRYLLTIFAGTLIASRPPRIMNAASIYMPESFAAVACFSQPTA